MKVGIIVHSHTENTLSVAEKLKENMEVKRHIVDLKRVVAVNEDPSYTGEVKLKEAPEISKYDLIIFAAPVRAFCLSPVMKKYLSEIKSLKGKKVECFVTQHLPYEWMGGKNSINSMKKICKSKEANIYEVGIINWSNKKREIKIEEVVDKLVKV